MIFCKYKIEKGSTENFLYRAFLDFKDPDSPIYHKILIDAINYISENGLLDTKTKKVSENK